jgi:hypothetical protein
MAKSTRIIEIGGVKMEVDLRYCKTVDHYHVGQNIKLLKKEYSTYEAHSGIIVGFDNFASRPTIVIAYLTNPGYNPEIKFLYYNSESKDIEITPMLTEEVLFDKADVMAKFDLQIAKQQAMLDEFKEKKAFFVDMYAKAFEAPVQVPQGELITEEAV